MVIGGIDHRTAVMGGHFSDLCKRKACTKPVCDAVVPELMRGNCIYLSAFIPDIKLPAYSPKAVSYLYISHPQTIHCLIRSKGSPGIAVFHIPDTAHPFWNWLSPYFTSHFPEWFGSFPDRLPANAFPADIP